MTIKISLKNIEHYSIFFNNLKLKDIIEIDPSKHLQRGSNTKVNVQCDICNIKRYIKYQAYYNNINSCSEHKIYTCDKCSHIKIKNYNQSKYGVEYYSQHPDRNERVKSTSIKKYGVEHYSKTDEYIKRRNKTNLNRFGFINPFMDKVRIESIFFSKYNVINPSQVEEFRNLAKISARNTMENNGSWIPTNKLSKWKIYKNKVRGLTRINIKKLDWNGKDFYDEEYIKDNFSFNHLHNNYPTIDHKTSIFDGFVNNIPVEVIASVDNLCWTKRIINITKNKKSHN